MFKKFNDIAFECLVLNLPTFILIYNLELLFNHFIIINSKQLEMLPKLPVLDHSGQILIEHFKHVPAHTL